MYQGTRWVILKQKKRSRKSHAWAPLTVSFIRRLEYILSRYIVVSVADPDPAGPGFSCRIRIRPDPAIHLSITSKIVYFLLMSYQYLNYFAFIDSGVEKAMRHHKFNTDIIGWYILQRRIRIRSGLC